MMKEDAERRYRKKKEDAERRYRKKKEDGERGQELEDKEKKKERGE